MLPQGWVKADAQKQMDGENDLQSQQQSTIGFNSSNILEHSTGDPSPNTSTQESRNDNTDSYGDAEERPTKYNKKRASQESYKPPVSSPVFRKLKSIIILML